MGTTPAWACVGVVAGAMSATTLGGGTKGVWIGMVMMGKLSSTTTCSSLDS